MTKLCVLVIYALVFWKTLVASPSAIEIDRKKSFCLVKTNLFILIDWYETDFEHSETSNIIFNYLRFLHPLTRDPCLAIQIYYPVLKRSFVKVNETNFMMMLEKLQEDYRFQRVPGTKEPYFKNNLKKSQVEKLVDEHKHYRCNRNSMTLKENGSTNTRNVILFFSNFLTINYKLMREVSDIGSCTVLIIAFSKYPSPDFLNWLPYHRLITHIKKFLRQLT